MAPVVWLLKHHRKPSLKHSSVGSEEQHAVCSVDLDGDIDIGRHKEHSPLPELERLLQTGVGCLALALDDDADAGTLKRLELEACAALWDLVWGGGGRGGGREKDKNWDL